MAHVMIPEPRSEADYRDPRYSLQPHLPSMYDLPSENPEDPGLPDEFHIYQPQLLRETFYPANYPLEQVFTGTDINVYYDATQTQWYKRPDWFAALGVPWAYYNGDLRMSYVIWQEKKPPYLVVELLSEGTDQEDLGKARHEIGQPPPKWTVYEQILKVAYYVVFDRKTNRVQYFKLGAQGYHEVLPPQQRLWLPEAGLGIGLWEGTYPQQRWERVWLRFYDANGKWIPTPVEYEQQRVEQEKRRAEREKQQAKQATQQAVQEKQRAEQEKQRAEQEKHRAEQAIQQVEQEKHRAEHALQQIEQEKQRTDQATQRAEQEQQRAEQERQRAERLAAQLKTLGIDPELF